MSVIQQSYSEDEKFNNFTRLVNTISFLKDGGRITEDWIEEHKQYILMYRELFPNLNIVNSEIIDSDFREICKKAEVLLAYLYNMVKTQNTFNVKIYGLLNEYILKICKEIFEHDELNDAMEMLLIK